MAEEPSQPVKKKKSWAVWVLGRPENNNQASDGPGTFLFVGSLNSSPIANHYLVYSSYGAFTLDVKSVLNENLGCILVGTQC
jgi:hypothetical protein